MIRIPQLKIKPEHTKEELKQAILKELRIPKEELKSYVIIKRSIDARKKPDIFYIYGIDAEVAKEEKLLHQKRKTPLVKSQKKEYQYPIMGEEKLHMRPVIVGMGPAGLFCGLILAKLGYNPIILERGESVEKRKETVEQFWNGGRLNPNSNVQFGEGGAGTFSDGKLNTLVKDEKARNRFVLETFVEAGASEEILFVNKPHIGTDVLESVVKNIRQEIIDLGGEVRFQSKVTDIKIENQLVQAIQVNEKEWIPAETVVLAIGHSARDTFEMLAKKPILMRPKSFAVGLRVEHPQEKIDFCQYGRTDRGILPVADYKVTKKLDNGRGVYSFCMCPGGYVVNASSEEERLAINGMSYQDRGGKNANSAIVVTVTPEDFGGTGILSGVEFQRKLEEAAYRAGGGKIPVQTFEDFCKNQKSSTFGEVLPCMKGEYAFANLKEILPAFVSDSIEKGMFAFDHMIKGFARGDALFSGIESRTSSPVRIERGETTESFVKGLYPCGEGAGYAGGITSAAMDGMRVAEAIVSRFKIADF